MKWEAPGLRPMNSPDAACGSIPGVLCNPGSSANDCKSGGAAGGGGTGGCANGGSAFDSGYCSTGDAIDR